jgi:hypothetical protein
MMSSDFLAPVVSSAADSSTTDFGVDFRRFGTGVAASITLSTERRLLTSVVERLSPLPTGAKKQGL